MYRWCKPPTRASDSNSALSGFGSILCFEGKGSAFEIAAFQAVLINLRFVSPSNFPRNFGSLHRLRSPRLRRVDQVHSRIAPQAALCLSVPLCQKSASLSAVLRDGPKSLAEQPCLFGVATRSHMDYWSRQIADIFEGSPEGKSDVSLMIV
jgi:hypothetical protein